MREAVRADSARSVRRVKGRTKILGIDPGLSGALALYDAATDELVHVWSMPITEYSRRKKRKVLDVELLACQIDALKDELAMAVVEKVQAMPGDGSVGAFSFGWQAGALHALLVANGVYIQYAYPSAWKTAMGLGRDKNKSREMAMERFGVEKRQYFIRKKDDGRAEAALLCLVGAPLVHRALDFVRNKVESNEREKDK